MSSSSEQTTNARRAARRGTEPQDAHRGFVPSAASDLAEALADREMADAERAVVSGFATEEQTTRVTAVGEARTHEDRRRLWMNDS